MSMKITNTTAPLSETQKEILTGAVENAGTIIWPARLKGGAIGMVKTLLLSKGLIAEQGEGLVLTPAGYESVGFKVPETSDTRVEQLSDEGDVLVTPSGMKLRPGTIQQSILKMLLRPEGATTKQIMEATGWASHTVRGAFSGAFRKKMGFDVKQRKVTGGKDRVYYLV